MHKPRFSDGAQTVLGGVLPGAINRAPTIKKTSPLDKVQTVYDTTLGAQFILYENAVLGLINQARTVVKIPVEKKYLK
jgi:hypothetical protein